MIYTFMSLLWIAGTIPFMIFSVIRLSAELHMLQQNSYRNDRYNGWLKERGQKQYTDFLALLAVIPVMFLNGFFSELIGFLLWVAIYSIFVRGRDKTPPKKPLVFTERATRLYVAALAIYFVPTVMFLFLGVANMGASGVARGICLLLLGVMPFFTPMFMLLANTLMQPLEEHKKSEYFDDAKAIIASHEELLKIAITGSFGKTSVKHVLNRMLEEKYYTLMPPGSYNTPMGLTRVIREQLKPIHEVFLAEMGAKQKGDVAELCELVSPKFGMITALGEAHLESFGTFENIVDTKFELIEALPEDGIAVLNFDDPVIRANAHRMKGSIITYGIHGDDLDFWAEKIRYNDRGMEFVLHSKDGAAIEMRTRLLGEHNILNIVGAAAMAHYLGINYKQMKRAVLSLAPVELRLELRSTVNGYHIIDDAFNSNPVGAAAAMDVLKRIEGGKKFLVTPGMIELGEKEFEENKKFGAKAAEACDYIALVGE
ncbi:MAG: UDP-N-acetylmuramoyl-tripeptide--D-alanyl-D-alanine ligase, partial [Firmicutes bacterium]|nr:UDP-N-acetylmuramoyl-tripeptide--D-alanyl-D-alanine ligase [Bacillota bacterium]